MMAGGIVMTSLSFIPMVFMAGGALSGNSDTFAGGFLGTGVLLGVGIPLIVIGARREPLASARLASWLTPHSAGLGLRLDL